MSDTSAIPPDSISSTDEATLSGLPPVPARRSWEDVTATISEHSPYLERLAQRHPELITDLQKNGPDATFSKIMKRLDALDEHASKAELMAAMREMKGEISLVIGMADISNSWHPAQVTHALSVFAESCVTLCTRFLMQQLQAKGVIDCKGEDITSGLFVLGMGKLGAFELNYSSDIDLMLLYDQEKLPFTADYPPTRDLIQLGNQLVEMLQERTEDGYVFRVDLRLRPDPGSTPLIVATQTALRYYETVGQNWERAALIKSRIVGGDSKTGERFQKELTPFIWRKYLDFAAIADIQSIKRQIDNREMLKRGAGAERLNAYNIKLGSGGIRDIEFYVQTQQLIWGGKLPELRGRGTCDGLDALAGSNIVKMDTAGQLKAAYHYLRRVEHALQMVNDEQTHDLPSEEGEWLHVAQLLGYSDIQAFQNDVMDVLELVSTLCRPLFMESGQLSMDVTEHGGRSNLAFTGVDDDPDTLETLRGMGFDEPETVSSTIRGWHHGRIRATRTERARQLLTELTPQLLSCFSKTSTPSAAFNQFDQFLTGLPEGIQILSLFAAQPSMLELVADIFGSAPRLAEMLSLHPRLLDKLLSPNGNLGQHSFRYSLSKELELTLSRARDYEDGLHLCRQFNQEYRFLIAVKMLIGDISFENASISFTQLAELILSQVVTLVQAEYMARHGVIKGSQFAVVALGKFGAGQMSFDSDMDMVFLYDAPDNAESTSKLSPDTYFCRMAQRIITAFTALMKYGRLYEVDTRLRPYGNDGALACRLSSFVHYYEQDAWSYEWFALTRARVVYGNSILSNQLHLIINRLLSQRHNAEQLKADLLDLRNKITASLPPKNVWDIKYQPGGLLDIELIIQYLQLVHAADHPEVAVHNPVDAVNMLTFSELLDKQTGVELLHCLSVLLYIHQILRICSVTITERTRVKDHFLTLLQDALGAKQLEDIEQTLESHYKRGSALFTKLLEC